MKDFAISPSSFIRDPEDRAFLGKISGYAFILYCAVPLVAGVFLPYWLSLTDHPFASLPTRLILLAATGGASFLIALAPALLVMRTRILRKIYVFMLFPVSMVSLAGQTIMYREFGTEFDERVFGMFHGQFAALWAIARSEYHLDWALALLLVASVPLGFWIGRSPKDRRRSSLWPRLGTAFLLLVSGSLALALQPDIARAEHYHPTKLASAPLYQVVSFLGKHLLVGQNSGYRGILEQVGEVNTDEYSEITNRLGATPEDFTHREVTHPAWLRKTPSHVYLFLMESIEHELVVNPELEGLAPYITRFAEEGVSVPHFSASSGCTIDAIHAMVSGVAAQTRYPVPRALTQFPLDTLPQTMRRANYTPLFLSASRRELATKGDACEAYGYDRYVGCPDVSTDIKSNDWGVSDGDFFKWAKARISGLESPHFITFLNVSNHAPYDAPLHELGDDVPLSEATIAHFVGRDREEQVFYAKHIMYADWKMGEMVEWLKSRHPDALFAFVGDHGSSKLRGEKSQQVPFILWNDRVIDGRVDSSRWFGTHMDILATLTNLASPEGTPFRTLGSPVWSLATDRVSSAGQVVLTSRGSMTRKGQMRETFPSAGTHDPSEPRTSAAQSALKSSAIQALSWGYLNGKVLPGRPSTSS